MSAIARRAVACRARRAVACVFAAALLAPVPARPEPSPEQLFVANCSACHQRHGRGVPRAFPALAGDALVLSDPQGIIRVLLNGRGGMPSFRSQLDDEQLAAIASYARAAWGNGAAPVAAQSFGEARPTGYCRRGGRQLASPLNQPRRHPLLERIPLRPGLPPA